MEEIIVNLITELENKKASEVVFYDTTNLTPLYDKVVVATALNERHIGALIEDVEVFLDKNEIKVKHVEGTPESGWMLVDAYDIVVHIMIEEERNRIPLDKILKGDK